MLKSQRTFILLQVTLPHIHFSNTEVMALQNPETIQEVEAMRQAHEACFEVCHASCTMCCQSLAQFYLV